MFEHYIILSSSYTLGRRIAVHYTYQGGIDKNFLKGILSILKKACNNEPLFSTHYVCTDRKSFASVASYDPFFEDVLVIDSVDEFVRLLKDEQIISGLDVAKYILSKLKCTHLQLEKLTYLCYADYLCKYGKPFFQDEIYAFRYGPVIESVYNKYSQMREIAFDIDECITRSRFLLIPDGLTILKSIDDTLMKYGRCSASELVDITHSENSPWSIKDSSAYKEVIDTKTIIEHHKFEEKYFEKYILYN